MRSAARLYRLQLALALAAVAAAVAGALFALRGLDFSLPAADTLRAACRSLPIPGEGGLALVLLLPAALGVAVSALSARSLFRQLTASRLFLSSLGSVTPRDVEGERASVFESREPQAFCAGFLRPRIFLSSAAASLPRRQLRAVVAHERYHARRRDPLRLLLIRTLGDALFFIPALRRLSDRYAQLAELAADEAAARQHGRNTLAAALLAFGEARGPAVVVGIAPERVDHLLGAPARWELPASLLLAAAAALVALLGLATTAAVVGTGTPLNVPLLLAQACMPLMIGLLVLAALAAVVSVAVHSRALGV